VAGAPPTAVPQLVQNPAPEAMGLPQFVQKTAFSFSFFLHPQLVQKSPSGGSCAPQFLQVIAVIPFLCKNKSFF
jgi:hypothetical protein